MKLSDEYPRVPLGQIMVKRDERQRREVDVSDIVDSIRLYGVLQPIVIERDYTLVFGERRLTAAKEVGLLDIPARFVDELSPDESQILELIENVQRKALDWQDEVRAIGRLHELYQTRTPDWAQTDTATSICLSPGQVARYLRVARDIDSPRIAQATGMSSAYNVLTRIDERKIDDAMSDILEASKQVVKTATTAKPLPGAPAEPKVTLRPTPESILQEDFLKWAPQYKGQPFNFIHCDFPYGTNLFAGPQSGKNTQVTYKDTKDVYQTLIKCLCTNLDYLMSYSGHLMFWLSNDVDILASTLDMFRALAPSLVFNTKPLIWLKSDNMGILADSKRGPRNIYETALIAAREDRLIIKAVSNAYAAPTDKSHHPSAKPEPVLRYFMEMFIDDNCRMLDPTCGGGSSLRAAESLGASQVLGLELDPDHCASARSALRSFRAMRGAAA